MLTYVILDLNRASWGAVPSDSFNNLLIYLMAVKRSSACNVVRIVNSRRVVWDSQLDVDFAGIASHAATSTRSILEATPADLGFALIQKPDTVLIYSLSPENPDHYLKYVKCMFAAQRHGIRIDAFCARENMLVKMCCRSTGGAYLQGNGARDLLGLLGHVEPQMEVFRTRCYCCNKSTQIGLVCPICLTIYCKFLPVCKRCKTKFAFSSAMKAK